MTPRRASASALALLLAAAVTAGPAAAAGTAARPVEEEGAAVWERLCAECHAVPARILRKVPGRSAEERRLWLEAFLPGHHAAEEADRAALIAYLLAL